jgi:Mn-dependent DtxR family transcriptional regulator
LKKRLDLELESTKKLDGLKHERLAQAAGGVWQLSPRGEEEARELVRRRCLWEAF